MGLSKTLKKIGAVAAPLTLGANLLDLSPDRQTQAQVPLETAEQAGARRLLYDFARTGAFGDFKAGQDLNLGYGDFGVTGTEQQGLSQLQQLLSSGIPEQFQLGDQALKEILGGGQEGIQAQFDPFNTQIQRQIRESTDAAKRESGYLGNLYSGDAIRRIGDVQSRGNETLTAQLAALTNQAIDRRLQAVPLAYQAGQAQENINLGRIGASQQFGGLARQLNDASIKARDAEILRRRQELGMPINAATSVIGSNVNFGVPSVTTSQPSTLMQLLQILGPVAGQALGAHLGRPQVAPVPA